MNIYEKLMYGVMIIFALASNVSTGITSACIVISAIIMMIQYIKTKNCHYKSMHLEEFCFCMVVYSV